MKIESTEREREIEKNTHNGTHTHDTICISSQPDSKTMSMQSNIY